MILFEFARRLLGGSSGRPAPKTYNQVNAEDAASRVDIRRATVLVVGANTGGDCQEFVRLGASVVHGLDVIDDIGKDFQHECVTYHKQSIEKTDLPNDSFDLVYSFATMEHVPDIAAGYAEMARLVKPGGTIFSMASPLWYSPYGHHMGCFHGHPWIHVVFDRAGILEYAREHGIDGERGYKVDLIVDYMLDDKNFNMRKAHEYDDAIAALTNVKIIENNLLLEDEVLLDHPLGKLALVSGYLRDDLLPVTHRLIAVGGRVD
jgi:SAM-dependent methyltransferase